MDAAQQSANSKGGALQHLRICEQLLLYSPPPAAHVQQHSPSLLDVRLQTADENTALHYFARIVPEGNSLHSLLSTLSSTLVSQHSTLHSTLHPLYSPRWSPCSSTLSDLLGEEFKSVYYHVLHLLIDKVLSLLPCLCLSSVE